MYKNRSIKKSRAGLLLIAILAVAGWPRITRADLSKLQLAKTFVTDRAVRGYVSELWYEDTIGVSSAQLDTLLESNYPHSTVKWKSVIGAVHATEAIAQQTKQSDYSKAMSSMVGFAKGQLFDFGMAKLGLGTVASGVDIYSLLNNVWDTENKAGIENQTKAYFFAREAGLSNDDIVTQATNGDVIIDYEMGWIIALQGHNSSFLHPADATPRQVWQVASFMWDLKQDPSKFEQEKATIGEQLRRGLADLSKKPKGKATPQKQGNGASLNTPSKIVLVHTIPGQPSEGYALSPDGSILATLVYSSNTTGSVQLWSTKTGKLIKTVSGFTDLQSPPTSPPPGSNIYGVSHGQGSYTIPKFSADGKCLVMAISQTLSYAQGNSRASLILIRNIVTGKRIKINVNANDINALTYIGMSSDGKLIGGVSQSKVRIWDRRTMAVKLQLNSDAPLQKADGLFYSANNNVVIGSGGTMQIWNINSGKIIWELNGVAAPDIYQFSANGKQLAFTYEESSGIPSRPLVITTRVFSVSSRSVLYRVQGAGTFSPDGNMLAVDDGTVIKLLDARSGKLKRTLIRVPYNQPISGLMFSPNSNLLINNGGSELCLWNLKTGHLIKKLTRKSGYWAVGFSRDSRTLIIGDDKFRVWRIQ